MNNFEFKSTSEIKLRLDAFLSGVVVDMSRSSLKKIIESGNVSVNGKVKTKGCDSVSFGDNVVLTVDEPREVEITAQDIPIDIVYQDDDIAVINKQQGLTVHPSNTQKDGTLVNAIMYHIKTLSGINGELRPGIVHRLDKNTSGLMVVAKNDLSHSSLSKQIEEKTAIRKYIALVIGNIKTDSGVIDAPIARHKHDRIKMAVVLGGKRSITNYKVIARFDGFTLVEFNLQTGRTHQIRVHSKHIGHPVACDDVYTSCKPQFKYQGQMLHSYYLGLTHPRTGEFLEFKADPPPQFGKILKGLQNDYELEL